MLACEAPQNSAHWPQYSPGVSGVSVSRFRRPGTTSRLPPSCGTQKLWITSGPSSVSWTGRPAGRWSSFAVATSSAGYRNSHHHWRPRTSTSSAPAAGAACVRKMTWIVGIAIRSSTSAGAIVQESSSSVWPRVCGGGGAPGLSRKRNSTHASPAKTTRAMTAATHVMIPYTWRISRAKSERAATVLMGPSHAQPPGRRAAAASPRRTWAHSLVCPFTRLEPTGAPDAPQGEARRRARAARAAARSPPARSPPSRSSRPRGGSGHPWTE